MNIQEINPYNQPETVIAIVSLYQKVFGSPPWNEGYLCPVCNATFGLSNESSGTCSECRRLGKLVPLAEYWPSAKVITDYYSEMQKENSICIVAKDDNNILGFAWGYAIEANIHIDSCLGAPGIHEFIEQPFFYIDEVAVHHHHQRKGIGRQLVREIIDRQTKEVVILRTLKNSQMQHLVISLGGSIIRQIANNRIIMKIR